jgi:D-threo-aldose 1-dehydrogenase
MTVPVVTLAGTGLVTSVLGFGCAGLYAEPSPIRRRRVLDAAHAAGIRHFDVAPMYGLGLAERELGTFARGRRDEIVIATKFGIAPTTVGRWIAPVQAPVRRLFLSFPALRRKARSSAAGPGNGRLGSVLYEQSGYDGAAARLSLERSLHELQTDYVDLLFLHDAQPGTVRGEDVCEYLERARAAGQIRAWGIAGEPAPTRRVSDTLPIAPDVLQVRDDPLDPDGNGGSAAPAPARITFGVVGDSVARIIEHVQADPRRRRAWEERVGRDCAEPDVVAGLLLARAVCENPEGVVLFSTTKAEHVRSAIEAITLATPGHDHAVNAFIGLLEAELRSVRADR